MMFSRILDNYGRKKICHSDGFTIVEVLIALAIFAIGILGVAKMQISSITGNTTARIHLEASAMVQERIESLMSLNYAGVIDGNSANADGYQAQWTVVQEIDLNGDGTNDFKLVRIVVNDPRGIQRSDITFGKAAEI